MMCPNCGATRSDICFEVKMCDIQFWECLPCEQTWMVRVPKNVTKYVVRDGELGSIER